MSYRNIFKTLIPVAVLFVAQTANAQIVIGPANPQEVPVFGAPLLFALGGFMMFLAYKLGLAKQIRRSSLAIMAGLLGMASIGSAIYPFADAQAGTAAPNNINISGSGQNSHNILISGGANNGYNRYDNNSGITLEVKSITLPGTCNNSATANQCTVGLSIANGSFCAIDCN